MIPKTLHQIAMPQLSMDDSTPPIIKNPALRLSFMEHNPLWSFLLWTNEKVQSSDLDEETKLICANMKISYVVKSDYLRYVLVYKYGGCYSDTDVRCNKNLDPLLDTNSFCGESYDGEMGNNFFGCVAGINMIGEFVENAKRILLTDPTACNIDPVNNIGVKAQAEMMRKFDIIYPIHYFNPFSWRDLAGREKEWPDSYTVHYWYGMDPDGWTHKRF
jgi:Glycosyltransferase sugar-binding region containing DXD motif